MKLIETTGRLGHSGLSHLICERAATNVTKTRTSLLSITISSRILLVLEKQLPQRDNSVNNSKRFQDKMLINIHTIAELELKD